MKNRTDITFDNCLYKMKKIDWILEDVFPKSSTLDFNSNFIPTSLTFHNNIEKIYSKDILRALNQIMAKSYLNLFYFIEEYIIQETNNLAAVSKEQENECKAITLFHQQEIKHQALFKRFIKVFDAGFPVKTKIMDCEKEVSTLILSNSRLAILLTTLHLEIITQEHYIHSVKHDKKICKEVARILKYHWIEEIHHANIDYLELLKYAPKATCAQKKQAVYEYGEIMQALNHVLAIQAQYDVESLELYLNAPFSSKQNIELQHIQHKSYTNIFILRGLVNPTFNQVVQQLFPDELLIFHSLKNQFEQLCAED